MKRRKGEVTVTDERRDRKGRKKKKKKKKKVGKGETGDFASKWYKIKFINSYQKDL